MLRVSVSDNKRIFQERGDGFERINLTFLSHHLEID